MKIKQMNPSSSPEYSKIPVQEKSRSPCPNNKVRTFDDLTKREIWARLIAYIAGVLFIFVVIPDFFFGNNFTANRPQIRLDSLTYCPINHKNNLVIWDLRFDFSNPNNHTTICFENPQVGIFLSNETKLLNYIAISEVCVGPRNHGPKSSLVEAFILDPYELNNRMMMNGTVSFDLKIQVKFYYSYTPLGSPYEDFYMGFLVCRNAKVVAISSGGGCGSLAGDPTVCSYEDYVKLR